MERYSEVPIKCPSCGTSLANNVESIFNEINKFKPAKVDLNSVDLRYQQVLVDHGIKNACCRMRIITASTLIDKIITDDQM
jgi:DNA-directed RNA polymerase subunit N (RpoN/RPB10)